jgi:20S proteasome alpha/beta subunit
MTVCVAAISSNGPCIVCIADKALSYGEYIQWDSDCTKILNLRNKAVAMISSDSEAHATRLIRHFANIGDFSCNRYDVAQQIEEQFRTAYLDIQEAEILTPQMLSKAEYIKAITGNTVNEHIRAIAKKMENFNLLCDSLICGYDDHKSPYILHVVSPGIVTDFTNVGFHAVGSGAEKAVAQLLFAEHKRTAGVPRTLYECFDAKAHAEMAVGVGYEWDACFVTSQGPKPLPGRSEALDRSSLG